MPQYQQKDRPWKHEKLKTATGRRSQSLLAHDSSGTHNHPRFQEYQKLTQAVKLEVSKKRPLLPLLASRDIIGLAKLAQPTNPTTTSKNVSFTNKNKFTIQSSIPPT